MKKAILAGALLAFCAGLSSAGEAHHYDLYYDLPVKAGSRRLDVGLNSADIGRLGDMGDVAVMHKYSISDDLEAGARATFGFLNEARDSFSSIVAGAKYGLNEKSAATLNLLAPAGDVDELGLSAGYMITVDLRGLKINNHLQVGFLDGYSEDGADIELLVELVEPPKSLGTNLFGYLDILAATHVDEFGDKLGVNLMPNIDYRLHENAVMSTGVSFGIVGDDKQDDLGLVVTLFLFME